MTLRHLDVSDEIGKDFRPDDGGESSILHIVTNDNLFNNSSFDNKFQDFTCSLSSIGGNIPKTIK